MLSNSSISGYLPRHFLSFPTHLAARRCSSLVRPTTCVSCTSSTIVSSQGSVSTQRQQHTFHLSRHGSFVTAVTARHFTAYSNARNNTANPSSSSPPQPEKQDGKQDPALSEPAVEPPDYLSEGELKVFKKLTVELHPTKLEVQDISGGCGSMYGLDIISPRFTGLSVIQQHKLVNGVLKEELKEWHGVQLKTKAP